MGFTGLIGEHLSHSFSPFLHHALGNDAYALREVPCGEFAAFLGQRDFDAVNVTIPYKKEAARLCDVLSDTAARIGAVNVVINRGGVLYGDNTDYFGLSFLLAEAGLSLKGKTVAVLGSGGAGAVACTLARDVGARAVITVSRSGPVDYDSVYRYTDIEVVINTTPVGMFPDGGSCPLDPARFPRLEGAVDLVYNPRATRFVLAARAHGVPAVGGLAMLTAQAVRSHELFFGTPFSDRDALIRDLTAKAAFSLANLVLIGMPGCGKSTVGRALAKLTGRAFVDLDEGIEAEEGRSVPDIFSARGEAYFREKETALLARHAAHGGQVISVGGGAVLSEENRILMKQNGLVVCLDRPTDELVTDGRPLSAGGLPALQKMYKERAPLYRALADVTIPVCGTPDDCAARILSFFESRKG